MRGGCLALHNLRLQWRMSAKLETFHPELLLGQNVIVGSNAVFTAGADQWQGEILRIMQPPRRLQFDCIFCVKHCRQYVDALYNSTFKPNTHRIELCFFLHPLISILQQQPSKRFPVRKLRLKIFRKIWGGLGGLEDTMNMQLCAHSEGSTSLNFLNDACDASHEQNIYGEFYIWSDTSHKQGAFIYDFISWIIELQKLWFIVSWPLQTNQNTTKQKSNDRTTRLCFINGFPLIVISYISCR